MRLKLYRAASMPAAMALARAELGDEALILSSRRIAQGVELTAALEPAEAPRRPAQPGPPSLAFHDIPEPIAARLSAGSLVETLPRLLRFGPLPIDPAGSPLILAGLPGAGKTLSVVRLATRLVLAGTAPMIVTTDGRRAGAAEELAAYTRLLGLNLLAANTPSTLARALKQRLGGAPVLIDTAGVNPFDRQEMAALRALAEICGAGIALVAAAGAHPEEAAEQACAFAEAGAAFLLPTRFDIARRLGGVIAAAHACGLTLTEAGIGPGAGDGLARITPEFLAARLLQTPHAEGEISHARST